MLALLNGMAFFLDRESALAETSFDYFIHLTPHTYPAMNATHVRRMLAFDERSYPPPNFLQAIHPSQWRLFSKEIDFLYTDLTLAYNSTLETQPMLETHNFTHPDRHRRILKLPRTDEHVILNHETVRQATDSMLAKRLLLTLGDTSHAVNRFFGGLVENCKDPIGRVITKTNLRCVNTKAFRMEVTHVLPEYRLLMPSVAFLRATSEPCLFVGFANVNTDVLDEIDRQLIIAPGLMGKPMGQGFHDIVRERLTAVLGNMPG